MAVCVDELDCLLALFAGQVGKAFCDGRVLEGDVFDAIAGALLPSRNPTAAEIAVAVKDHHGLGRWGGDADHGEVLTEPESEVN